MATVATDGSSRLSPSERLAILEALEEFTNVLAIYHNTLKRPTEHDNDIPFECIFPDPYDKEMSKMQLSPDDIAGIEDIKERITNAIHYEDSLYLRRITEELKEEIRERGTYEVLAREVEKIVEREREVEAMFERGKKLSKLAEGLQRTMAEEKIAYEEEKKRMLRELAEEQREAERLKLIADVEREYVTGWHRARHELNSHRCKIEIEKLEGILNDQQSREKSERRFHMELTKFLIEDTARIERKREEWEGRYAREKVMYEREIRQLRIQIDARRKELEKLKEEYRSNQDFIDTYLAEKEAARMEKEREERTRRSAIRIQAWWRGVMVRRKLGPYRPAEKKKKRSTKTKK